MDLRSEAEVEKDRAPRLPKTKAAFSPTFLDRFTFLLISLMCPGQFQDFSLHDPLHGTLLHTYLRPSWKPHASFPSSPAALANGTVPVPKPKGD